MKKTTKFSLCLCLIVFLVCSLSIKSNASSLSAGKVTTKSTALNVRKTASASSAVIATLKKDSYVTLISKSGNRWKVEYQSGKYGYCHEDYISEVENSVKYVNITSGVLNVRSSASTSSSIKATLSKAQTVLAVSKSGDFTKIIYNGSATGYVKTDFLSSSKPAESTQTIKLSVPYYNQTDSKWKNIKIGTSGDTIGTSGCTTACLAMTESVRLSKSVTPKDMAASLKYADAGWLYWPSNYTVKYASSDYLSTVYKLLKENKPVILGAKKENGSQHWVVITSFSGNPSSPKVADFSINDPGSKTRTVLSQFISDYPVLYKIAYYN